MEVIHPPYGSTASTTTQSLPPRDSRPLKYHAQPISAPASQQSVISNDSVQSSSDRYTLDNVSSNVSQQTSLTDLTAASSPPSVAIDKSKPHALQPLQIGNNHDGRARTPENGAEDCSLASPMSLTSPTTAFPSNGTKRTASGHVKNAASYSSTQSVPRSPRKGRAESISSSGSRAGELAASLKMRLGYAMAKVQNGWEHKTIGELERMTSQKMSPNNRYSMSYVEPGMRSMLPVTSLDGVVQHNPYQATGPASPPSKRRSGAFNAASIQAYAPSTVPSLQPAADIQSHGIRHMAPGRPAPAHGQAMSPPRTPAFPASSRPPTIRTNTQTAEAERDALQALTQLGSPHNSQYSRHHNASQASSSQASPLRAEFMPARKVNFARGDSESSAAGSSLDGTLATASHADRVS